MKSLFIVALLSSAGLAAPVWACSPPPPLQIPLPPGVDGKLPVVQPDLDPNFPYIPPTSGGACPTLAKHASSGTVAGLSNSEVIARLNTAQPVQLAPAWQSAPAYVAGDRVSYAGINYKARWWNQNEAPGAAWGAWEQESTGGPQPWVATRSYNTGDRVISAGKLFEAKWWTQGEQPGGDWGAWALKGDAPAGDLDPMLLPGLFSATVNKTGNTISVSFLSSISVTYVHTVTAACTVKTESDALRWAATWKIRLDGVTAHEAPITENLSSGTQPPPPPPARLPDGSCSRSAGSVLQTNSEGRIQRASATVPAGASRFISVWSCSAPDQCRPSTLLEHQQMGKSQYWSTVPPYITYVPVP
ncbi:carbohydrate-binding protein [Chitinolyticbacter meiyuanensis]|uniref:carbohydrate-binding protein n=1 Tax=Chitinolyticbacter meiyuanensis TaxID=682798 RepID=UPI00165246A9|nr:carbohydrate-binding protein [Chitinolyticbacter meiyuanensis]